MMNMYDGKKLLISTSDWFYAPDGQTYKAAWGTVKIRKAEELLGVPARNHANWYAVVDEKLFIPGCKVDYAIICNERPSGTAVFCCE
jgi:hypothetical protein